MKYIYIIFWCKDKKNFLPLECKCRNNSKEVHYIIQPNMICLDILKSCFSYFILIFSDFISIKILYLKL